LEWLSGTGSDKFNNITSTFVCELIDCTRQPVIRSGADAPVIPAILIFQLLRPKFYFTIDRPLCKTGSYGIFVVIHVLNCFPLLNYDWCRIDTKVSYYWRFLIIVVECKHTPMGIIPYTVEHFENEPNGRAIDLAGIIR
jgi:hypothetical protein